MTDKRCGTCRYFGTEHDVNGWRINACNKSIPTMLPTWARDAIEWADNEVSAGDGTDCDAWEAKP